MSVIVRTIEESDFEQWRELWQGYMTFYQASVAPEIYPDIFQRFVSVEHANINALVAEENGQLLGFVHYIFHAHNWRLEGVCYLQDLFVAQNTRGKGVGKQLIEGVYAKADENGSPSVYWMTQNDNHTARRLYDGMAKLTDFIKYQRG